MTVAAGRLRWYDREDLVQDALLRVHVAVQEGKVLADPISYAVQVARRLLVDNARRSARELTLLKDLAGMGLRVSQVSSYREGATPACGDVGHLFRGRVQKAIVRGVLAGQSLTAVAEHLGLPKKEVQRVTSHILRCLKAYASPGRAVGCGFRGFPTADRLGGGASSRLKPPMPWRACTTRKTPEEPEEAES